MLILAEVSVTGMAPPVCKTSASNIGDWGVGSDIFVWVLKHACPLYFSIRLVIQYVGLPIT